MIAPCIRSTSVKSAAVLLFALLVPVWNLALCAPNPSPLLADFYLLLAELLAGERQYLAPAG